MAEEKKPEFNEAFLARTLAVKVAQGVSVSYFVYGTENTVADVSAANFFNAAAGVLKPGDIIDVHAWTEKNLKIARLAVKSIIDGDVTTQAVGSEVSIDYTPPADGGGEPPKEPEKGKK